MKMKNKRNSTVIISAILGLSAIEVVALFKGVNGQLMTLMVAVIAGLGGLMIPTPKILKGGK